VWNKAGYELKLIIFPPFWATIWFRAIVIAAILGAVFLYFKIRENRIKREQVRQTAINKQIAEIRMSALQAQMNPHFIFNSLNSIQHLISIHEKEEAINCLSKFSKLIRKMLENSRESVVTVSNELELLELYIQLEQLRFNHKFDYHLSVDERIDPENTEIPPLIIQPYVENAILHGLINRTGRGDLWFSIEKNNGSLICKVEDNGVGRARAQEIEEKKISKHKSLGIKVTDERVSTLSTLLDSKMEVVIEDLFETRQAEEAPQPAGTRVTITIPIKDEE
jgi:sensor histidine kinase YesM